VTASRPTLLACALLAAASCKTAPVRSDVPAVVKDPGPRSVAELAKIVSAALNGASVTLADDALTKESTLVIERAPQKDPSGLPAQGRETGKPERFQLVKSGEDCVLVHEGTGRPYRLLETTCSAL